MHQSIFQALQPGRLLLTALSAGLLVGPNFALSSAAEAEALEGTTVQEPKETPKPAEQPEKKAQEKPKEAPKETPKQKPKEKPTPVGVKGQKKVPGTGDPKKVEGAGVQKGHEGHDHGPGEGHGKDGKSLQSKYGQEVDPKAKLEIAFGAEAFDLGLVQQGERRAHTFELESKGEGPVKIFQAKPTCGCTVGDVRVQDDKGEFVTYNFGDPIAVGRKVEIEATLDTTNKRGKTQVRINVSTNDPVGVLQLALSANVEPFMTVSPNSLILGELGEGAERDDTVTIRTNSGTPILLTIDDSRPAPKPEELTFSLEPDNPDENGRASLWHLKTHVGPVTKEGTISYQIVMKSDVEIPGGKQRPDGSTPTHTAQVNFNARVLGALTCTPPYFSLGIVRPGQVVSRTVRLTSHDEEFALDGVQAEIRGFRGQEFPHKDVFSTHLRPVPGENALEIEVRLDGLPDGSDGTFKGELQLVTGHTKKPEIAVTFSGVCRAGVGVGGSTPPKGARKVPNPKKGQGSGK